MAYTDAIVSGARLGLTECRHQFTWERWNCPVTTPPLLDRGRAFPGNDYVHIIRSFADTSCSTELGERVNCAWKKTLVLVYMSKHIFWAH